MLLNTEHYLGSDLFAHFGNQAVSNIDFETESQSPEISDGRSAMDLKQTNEKRHQFRSRTHALGSDSLVLALSLNKLYESWLTIN